MSRAAEEVLEAAMALSEEDRAEVAARLEESLGVFATPEIAAAWQAEIAERIRAIDAGEVELLTEEEVNNRLRAKYGPLFD
jgi:putative addiction module component (TIGR02574 family)